MFEIIFTSHEREARELLLKDNLVTEEKLSVATSNEVEDMINEKYVAYRIKNDWLLIPKEKEELFDQVSRWIVE